MLLALEAAFTAVTKGTHPALSMSSPGSALYASSSRL
jgi:hypothetical protein